GGIVRFRMEGNFKYSYIRGVQLSWFAKKSRNRLPGQKNLARYTNQSIDVITGTANVTMTTPSPNISERYHAS
ncbi:hypothetical protein, partial [Bifidobacterium longum]|uniref:hypothetical protein n=1 Tax=Bifidobacterium longum TaxID=216816 RepID=UPI001F19D87E